MQVTVLIDGTPAVVTVGGPIQASPGSLQARMWDWLRGGEQGDAFSRGTHEGHSVLIPRANLPIDD